MCVRASTRIVAPSTQQTTVVGGGVGPRHSRRVRAVTRKARAVSSPLLTVGASGYQCAFKREDKYAALVLPEGHAVGGYSMPPSSADATRPIVT